MGNLTELEAEILNNNGVHSSNQSNAGNVDHHEGNSAKGLDWFNRMTEYIGLVGLCTCILHTPLVVVEAVEDFSRLQLCADRRVPLVNLSIGSLGDRINPPPGMAPHLTPLVSATGCREGGAVRVGRAGEESDGDAEATGRRVFPVPHRRHHRRPRRPAHHHLVRRKINEPTPLQCKTRKEDGR